jgi:hypothetical protein
MDFGKASGCAENRDARQRVASGNTPHEVLSFGRITPTTCGGPHLLWSAANQASKKICLPVLTPSWLRCLLKFSRWQLILSWPIRKCPITLAQYFSPFLARDGRQVCRPDPTRGQFGRRVFRLSSGDSHPLIIGWRSLKNSFLDATQQWDQTL